MRLLLKPPDPVDLTEAMEADLFTKSVLAVGNVVRVLAMPAKKVITNLPVADVVSAHGSLKDLKEAPLSCNCSSKWIQRQISKTNGILGPLSDSITCFDDKSNKTLRLSNVSIPGCGQYSLFTYIFF